MSKNISNHPAIKFYSDINAICAPLKHLDITYFGHAKIFDDKHFSAISSNPEFFSHYLKNKYYNTDIHLSDHDGRNRFIVWDDIDPYGETKKMDEEGLAFGIKHTFTLVECSKNIKNYYHFATHVDTNAFNQVYLANLDILQIYIRYFNEVVSNTKHLSESYSIQYTIDEHALGFQAKSPSRLSEARRKQFLDSICKLNTNIAENNFISVTKSQELIAYLQASYNICLTQREAECLLHTLLGKPAKLVAVQLGISRRTVEEYLDNIKIKFAVHSKSALIEKAVFYINHRS